MKTDMGLLYTRLRHELGFERSPEFLKWVGKQVTNRQLHHILGSVRGRKYSDYLIAPVTAEEHRKLEPQVGDTDNAKAEGLIDVLPVALKWLIKYIQYLEERQKC